MEESGEKARLEEYLRQKLIECGWKDQLKEHCMGRLSFNWIELKKFWSWARFERLEICNNLQTALKNLEFCIDRILMYNFIISD